LKLIADGKTTKEIGKGMGISLRTAETYRRRVALKTGIVRIALLTRYWIEDHERREARY